MKVNGWRSIGPKSYWAKREQTYIWFKSKWAWGRNEWAENEPRLRQYEISNFCIHVTFQKYRDMSVSIGGNFDKKKNKKSDRVEIHKKLWKYWEKKKIKK